MKMTGQMELADARGLGKRGFAGCYLCRGITGISIPGRPRLVLCGLALVMLLIATGSMEAVTVNARSLSLADVTTAITSASNGDTVILPAGTATWTAPISVSKGISIIGAGKDVTVIVASKAGRTDQRTFTISAKDGQPMFRLSGLTIRGVTGQTGGTKGVIYMGGNAHRFRIDHIKMDKLNESLLLFNGYLWGVVDHCDFNCIGTSQIVMGHSTWPAPGGGIANNGNGSWADGPYFGTERFIFIEDCNFTGSSLYATDANNGARYVFRHNFTTGLIGGHGTESGQVQRGTRAVEIYENISDRSQSTDLSMNDKPIQIRSGAYVIFNNVFKGWYNPSAINYYRGHNVFKPWGGSDGINPWDNNDSPIYASGTVSGASSGTTVKLPLSGFTADQFNGYVLRNTSSGSGVGFGTITSSTASSGGTANFSYTGSAGYGQENMKFAVGERFEIRKVMAGLDAPARGKGDLLAGDLTTIKNTRTGTRAWPNNALEGIYFWNNRNNSSTGPLATFSYGAIPRVGGGYYNSAKPDYTPYVYPHPLTQAQPAVSPPTDLKVTSGQ